MSAAADPTETALRDEILGLAARLTAMLGKRTGGTFADAWQDCARAGLLAMTVPASSAAAATGTIRRSPR